MSPPHRPALHIQAARPPSPPQPAHRNSPLRPSPVRSVLGRQNTHMPHVHTRPSLRPTPLSPSPAPGQRLHSLHSPHSPHSLLSDFPPARVIAPTIPLSHYPPASMLQADNVNNRRRQRQRQRPSVQHPLSSCLPLRPSCLSTTTAELDTLQSPLSLSLSA
jgi:hypothetical protein